MIDDSRISRDRLEALSRPSGALALVAIDQRESLRAMLGDARLPATTDAIERFKVSTARALTPLASGILVDPLYGLEPVLASGTLAPGCALIVAADRIEAAAGQIVGTSVFDESLDLEELVARGAVALKLLVLWRPDHDDERTAMVARFVERCSALGVLSLVEGVVRGVDVKADPRAHVPAVIAAARELTSAAPDIYKAEVPTLGLGSPDEIEEASAVMSAAVPCPWVVLSAGTSPDAFPEAVRASCRGGASGFLAGRAVWSPALEAAGHDVVEGRSEPDEAVDARIRTDAVARLRGLIEIVDQVADRG